MLFAAVRRAIRLTENRLRSLRHRRMMHCASFAKPHFVEGFRNVSGHHSTRTKDRQPWGLRRWYGHLLVRSEFEDTLKQQCDAKSLFKCLCAANAVHMYAGIESNRMLGSSPVLAGQSKMGSKARQTNRHLHFKLSAALKQILLAHHPSSRVERFLFWSDHLAFCFRRVLHPARF